MERFILILEDDPSRRAAMMEVVAALGSQLRTAIFENSRDAISWLTDNANDAVLISLDHDLEGERKSGEVQEVGTGRDVADFLATRKPACPVIIHTSNSQGAEGMRLVLSDAGWTVIRVWPLTGPEWIKKDWAAAVTRLLLPAE